MTPLVTVRALPRKERMYSVPHLLGRLALRSNHSVDCRARCLGWTFVERRTCQGSGNKGGPAGTCSRKRKRHDLEKMVGQAVLVDCMLRAERRRVRKLVKE